jgi:hypothetical protein
MNPNFTSPRHLSQNYPPNGSPFYHPQKELHPFSAPNYPKSPNSAHFIPPPLPLNSKSYAVKPLHEPVKVSANSSGYLKSSLDLTSHQSNSNGFGPIYPRASNEMTKSSIYDNNKLAETSASETKPQVPLTPPRRQPRFSEPAMFDSPFELTQDTKASFIPYAKKDSLLSKEELQETHFFKKQLGTPEQAKEEKEGSREWIRQANRARKTQKLILLENFELVKSLGKGKYGQVYLAR